LVVCSALATPRADCAERASRNVAERIGAFWTLARTSNLLGQL
jgi:hypothetical protein